MHTGDIGPVGGHFGRGYGALTFTTSAEEETLQFTRVTLAREEGGGWVVEQSPRPAWIA
jgi:hypothetical protein